MVDAMVGCRSVVGGRRSGVTGDLFWREESTWEMAGDGSLPRSREWVILSHVGSLSKFALQFILSRVLAGTLGGAFGFGGRPRRSGRTLLSTQPLSLSTMD